jgi:hypothetical protein
MMMTGAQFFLYILDVTIYDYFILSIISNKIIGICNKHTIFSTIHINLAFLIAFILVIC